MKKGREKGRKEEKKVKKHMFKYLYEAYMTAKNSQKQVRILEERGGGIFFCLARKYTPAF